MVVSKQILKRNSKYLVPIAILAALAFNNWALGPWLNSRLFSANGSVSEFSGLDQPHHTIFRTLDVLSGLLFMLLAILLSQYVDQRSRWRHALLWSLAILGFANVMDATFTLHCSETLDPHCTIPVSLSPGHFELPDHAYSSVVIAVCYLVMPLAGYVYGRANKMKLLTGFSILAVLVAFATLVSACEGYFTNGSFSVRTSGTLQELQMIIVGLWVVALAYDIYKRFSLSLLKRRQPNVSR